MTLVWRALGAIGALLLVGAAPQPARWTPGWTASMWQAGGARPDVAVDNATVSFSVRVGLGGDRIRLRLSNEYGGPFRVGAATVRIAGGKTVPVTFAGQTSKDFAAGAVVNTDAVRLTVKPFDVVQV